MSLQFYRDPQQDDSSDSQSLSSERSVPSSLLPLIGQTAETADEKYRLLEQRDKIMRQGEATNHSTLFLISPFRWSYDNISALFMLTCSHC
jgi:hypothetical protein